MKAAIQIGEASPVDTDVNEERAGVNKCSDEWMGTRVQGTWIHCAKRHRYEGTLRLS